MKVIYNNYETDTQTLNKYGFLKKVEYYSQHEEDLNRLFKRIERRERIQKLINKLKNNTGGIANG